MARPCKDGLDSFAHSVDAIKDEGIDALRALYGNDGYAFYFILLERIFKTKNAELDVSAAETRQILGRNIGVSLELFDSMLVTAIKFECFDKKQYEKYSILTNDDIKKQIAARKAKRNRSKIRYTQTIETKEVITNEESFCPVSAIVSAAETPAEINQAKEEKEEKTVKEEKEDLLYIQEKEYKEKINKKEKKKKNPNPELFEVFWKIYDRRNNKPKAVEQWKKLNESEQTTAIEHAKRFVLATEQRFRPHPERYLRDKRFYDDIIPNKNNKIGLTNDLPTIYEDYEGIKL